MLENKFTLSPSDSIIIAGVVVASAIMYANAHPSAQLPVSDSRSPVSSVNVSAPSAGDHVLGNPRAPIILIEYSDFQCPFCSMVYPTLKKIVDESNGQIAWIYRHYPLTQIHPQALPAANAAECVAEQLGDAGFWKYTDAIFADQSKLTPEYSASLAKQFGADMTKYNSCVSSQKYLNKINADTAEAQANGGNGTPYTIVWTPKKQIAVSGAQPYEQFISAINSIK